MSYRYDTTVPPEPPKKALYIYEYIKQQHPNLRITQVTRIIGDMWKYLDPKLKERYQQQYEINKKQAAADRSRYENQFGRQARSRKSKKVKRAMVQIRRYFDHRDLL